MLCLRRSSRTSSPKVQRLLGENSRCFSFRLRVRGVEGLWGLACRGLGFRALGFGVLVCRVFGFKVSSMRLMAEGFRTYGWAGRSDAICRTSALQDRL